MVLEKTLKIKPSSRNVEYYRKIGYNEASTKNFIEVKNEDVTDGCRVKEKIQCDCCGKILIRNHDAIIDTRKSFGVDLCPDCSKQKRKEKVKETNLKKYGVEYPMQSKEIKEKAKKTTLEHYGVEYSFQKQEVQLKAKQSIKEKYGVNNIREIEEINKKIEETNLKKYGVKNVFASNEIKEKIKETNKNNLGVENPSQFDEIKEKKKQTLMNNWGVRYPLQNSEILNKVKQTTFKRWGVENAMRNPIIKEKARRTLEEKGSVPTSQQQIKLFEMCKDNFKEFKITLNKQVKSFNLDIEIITSNNIKIDLEYDGWYWHKNKGKDFARDYIIKKEGYKIIRVCSGKQLPTIEQIQNAINYVSQENKNFAKIVLSDWKE